MIQPEKKLFCPSDAEAALAVEQRLKAFLELGLLEAETIPVFEAATQTAADFLGVPICILGFLDRNRHWFKSAVGLSRLGLMNKLAQERQLSCEESFCTSVVESHQVMAINDTLNNPAFAKSVLVQHYGIRAYLGVPLMNAVGHCLGTIAVMDLEPRIFAGADIKFLEIIARWSMSEFERNRLLKDREAGSTLSPPRPLIPKGGPEIPLSPPSYLHPQREPRTPLSPEGVPSSPLSPEGTPSPPYSFTESLLSEPLSTIQVKLELLAQLTQELRTPLTSILGMAGVVGREIYGPLTNKQKEYLEIIQNSGRDLLSMVNEISELGALNDSTQALDLTSVDIEMLCQQAINTLSDAANRREQIIRLSVEPGRSRIWVLDKDKIRQLLYHLVFGVIQAATTGSIIRIHVSHKDNGLNLTVSASHPWLGDSLIQVEQYFVHSPVPVVSDRPEAEPYNTDRQLPEPPIFSVPSAQPLDLSISSSGNLAEQSESESDRPNGFNHSREKLRLLLSCHLAQWHGGQISIQGTPELGYRYVVSLPELAAVEESL